MLEDPGAQRVPLQAAGAAGINQEQSHASVTQDNTCAGHDASGELHSKVCSTKVLWPSKKLSPKDGFKRPQQRVQCGDYV